MRHPYSTHQLSPPRPDTPSNGDTWRRQGFSVVRPDSVFSTPGALGRIGGTVNLSTGSRPLSFGIRPLTRFWETTTCFGRIASSSHTTMDPASTHTTFLSMDT